MKRVLVLSSLLVGLGLLFQPGSQTNTLSVSAAPGGTWADPGSAVVAEADLRAAATKALKVIQKSQSVWYQRETCTSCHHQLLPEFAIDLARERGVPIDETVARSTTTSAFAYLKDLDATVQAYDYIDVVADAWQLVAAHSARIKPNLTTSVEAHFIASRQLPDGSWPTIDDRPPQSSSTITTTALSARALQYYLPASSKRDLRTRVRLARAWLLKARPRNTEDRTFQLLGLKWTGAAQAAITNAARRLLAEQRSDGGWSQMAGMNSDAYATGEVLVALTEGGGISTGDAAYQRGLRYLLKSQEADGSWRIKSRLHPPAPVSPPYVNMEFPPFQHDQFISIFGTTWAATALLQAIPEQAGNDAGRPEIASIAPPEQPEWVQVALNGTSTELRKLLDDGLKPDSKTAEGTTALMLAARDSAKVRLLLERGADVNAQASSGLTPLMVASRYRGNAEVVKLMLAKGARVNVDDKVEVRNDASALFYSVMAGDLAITRALVDAGAKRDRMNVLGFFPLTPLNYAISLGNSPVIRYLVSKGADPNELDDDKISAVAWAAILGRPEVVDTLIGLGAHVNTVDRFGMTPLLYAASIDFGDTAVMRKLLAAGAEASAKNKEGKTALDLARSYGHESMVRLLSGKMAAR